MPARLVDSAAQAPGCCLITGQAAGPLIDTQRLTARSGRAYLAAEYVAELASTLLGMVDEEDVRPLRARVAELEAEVAQLCDALGGYDTLKRAIGATLSEGLVVEKRTGRVRLRQERGLPAVEIDDLPPVPQPAGATQP